MIDQQRLWVQRDWFVIISVYRFVIYCNDPAQPFCPFARASSFRLNNESNFLFFPPFSLFAGTCTYYAVNESEFPPTTRMCSFDDVPSQPTTQILLPRTCATNLFKTADSRWKRAKQWISDVVAGTKLGYRQLPAFFFVQISR